MIDGLDDLTPERIGAALTDAGVVDGTPVSATVAQIGEGVGLLGTLAHVRLDWPPGVAGPRSIMAKLPTTDPGNRAIVDRFGYDRREAGVYRELLPRAGAPAPVCLARGWDESTGRGWLLLEDLTHLTTGDQVAGATDAEVLATVDALAAWHAAFWDDPTLGDRRWLPDTRDPVVAGYGELFDMMWPVCREMLADVVDERTASAVGAARRRFDDALDEFAVGPRTLVHGDARLDNLRFGVDGAVLLDFQLAAHGRGVYDLAFFCAGSLSTETRRRLEPAILDRYVAALRAGGVTDYDLEQARADYVLGHALNLPNPVTAIVAVTPGDERGAEMLRRNLTRALAAVADHHG